MAEARYQSSSRVAAQEPGRFLTPPPGPAARLENVEWRQQDQHRLGEDPEEAVFMGCRQGY